ncbi:MAG TPA: YcnI family protein [Pseudolabrys sp.]
MAAAISAMSMPPAVAHVILEQKQAPVGTPYRAEFRVPHGCGDSATVRLSVHIPEGVVAVKPMAKPGWQIDIARGPYEKSYSTTHGARMTEGVKDVVWSGGRLPNELFDDFVLSTFIANDLTPGDTLYFPVVQECEKGIHRWIEIPAANRSGEPLNEPAPGVTLLPKQQENSRP